MTGQTTLDLQIQELSVAQATDKLAELCAAAGLLLVLRNRSVTTNSAYFKFEDPRMGSLTVRDHKHRQKYAYRWILQAGYTGERRVVQNGTPTYRYGFNEIPAMVKHLRNYQCAIIKRATTDFK